MILINSNDLHWEQYISLVFVYTVMVLILLCKCLPKKYLHSLNMNEYMKNNGFFKDVSSRYSFVRYNKPMFLANSFFSRFNMIFPQHIFIQPRNLNEDFILIMLLAIFDLDIFKGNLSLAEF